MTLKKAILITTLLTSSAVAAEDNFYVKPSFSGFYPANVGQYKGKVTLLPSFAIGYNFSDKVRVDVSIEHFSNIKHTVVLTDVCPFDNPSILAAGNHLCTHAKITNVSANLFVDIIKVKKTSLYGGIGGGVARSVVRATLGDIKLGKIYKGVNFTYAAYAGVAHKVSNDVTFELGYNYKHLSEVVYSYKGHSVSSAIRIDL